MTVESSASSHSYANSSITQALMEDLFDLLKGHDELLPLYQRAVKRVSERKFENHIHGFLRAYGKELRSEAQTHIQVQAAVFVRRSARQVAGRITRALTTPVKPPALEGEIVTRKRQVNQWLEGLAATASTHRPPTPQPPQEATSTKEDLSHETQEVQPENQDGDDDGIEEEDDTQEYDQGSGEEDSEEDSEEGHEEDIKGKDEENEKKDSDHAELRHLMEITGFLTSSQAFTNLTQSIRDWVNPKTDPGPDADSLGVKETCIQNTKEGGETSLNETPLPCPTQAESGIKEATNIDTRDLKSQSGVGAGVIEDADGICNKREIPTGGHNHGPTITTASFLSFLSRWFREPRLPNGYRRLRWKCVSSYLGNW